MGWCKRDAVLEDGGLRTVLLLELGIAVPNPRCSPVACVESWWRLQAGLAPPPSE